VSCWWNIASLATYGAGPVTCRSDSMFSHRDLVICGGGIAGLVAALVLADRGLGHRTLLVESEPNLGGLLRSIDYGDGLVFDYGMHTLQETGVAELDDLVFSLLPQDEWHVLPDGRQDVAGALFNGVLQLNTPYPDLRSLDSPRREAVIDSFKSHLRDLARLEPSASHFDPDQDLTAETWSRSRFGDLVTSTAIAPAMSALYWEPPSRLAPEAFSFFPLSRVAFCDEPEVQRYTASDSGRSVVAWSDQRTLPRARSSGLRGFYPRQLGMGNVISSLTRRLLELDVMVKVGTSVHSLEGDGRVDSVILSEAGVLHRLERPAAVLWSAGLNGLCRALGVDVPRSSFDVVDRPATILANVLLEEGPRCLEDLYYLLCYDPTFSTYRVTNYRGYCPSAETAAGVPITLEMRVDKSLLGSPGLRSLVVEEVGRLGLLDSGMKVIGIEHLRPGFPIPTLESAKLMEVTRSLVLGRGLENLDLIGANARRGLFFQSDIMRHLHQVVLSRW
jgi:protoporphyrinogen oxidase